MAIGATRTCGMATDIFRQLPLNFYPSVTVSPYCKAIQDTGRPLCSPMKLRRFIHKLRMFFTILIVLGIVGVISAVIYLHSVGVPDFVREQVLDELKKRNIHLTFDSLKYKLNQGLVGENIKVFNDNKHENQVFAAEALTIDMDKTKLLRQVYELDSASIFNGAISLPIAPDIPNSPTLNINDIAGSFSQSNQQQIESSDGLSFHYHGVKIVLKGRAWITPSDEEPKKLTIEQQQARVDLFHKVTEHIQKLKWSSPIPPTLTITSDGDLSDFKQLVVQFSLTANDISYNGVSISNLKFSGELNKQLLRINKFSFNDTQGNFNAQADLSLAAHRGHFSMTSTANFKQLIREVLGKTFADEVDFNGSNLIEANGSVTLPHTTEDGDTEKFHLQLIGKAECRDVEYFGVTFDYIGTLFSWKDKSLFLDKLQAYHNDSEFNGRLLMTEKEIKFSSNSSLPPQVFMPFLKGRGFDRTLAEVVTTEESLFNLSAKGTINRQDITDWKATGDIYIGNVSYRDTKITEASVDFNLSNDKSVYTNASAEFDHSNWWKVKKFGGDTEGYGSADRVEVHKDPVTGFTDITLDGVEGKMWPAPVIRLFDRTAFSLFENLHLESPITFARSDFSFNFKPPIFHTQGNVHLSDFVMSGYRMKDTKFKLDIKRGDTIIKDISTTIDYAPYFKEKLQAKATPGKLQIDKVDIQYDIDSDKDQLLIISGIKGAVWPGAATALFNPKTANFISKLEFTQPIVSNSSNLIVIQNQDTWTTILKLDVDTMAYNHVAIKNGTSEVTISDGETLFKSTKLDFDNSNYTNFIKHGGSDFTTASADTVVIANNRTTVTNLEGKLWPGLVASMFNKESAEMLDKLDFTTPVETLGSDLEFFYGDKPVVKASLKLGQMAYNDIPLRSADMQFLSEGDLLTFSDITANFDHSKYPMRAEFGGPNSSVAKAKKITLNTETELVSISSLAGNFWPAPAVGLFSKEIASELEEFRFATPPFSNTSGTVDISDAGKHTQLTTTLNAGRFRYNFLDEDVNGTSFTSTIQTNSQSVTLNDIKVELLGTNKYKHESKNKMVYPLSGTFTFDYIKDIPTYVGTLALNRISIAGLAKTYDFEDLNKGQFSTLLQFKGDTSGTKSLNSTATSTFHVSDSNIANIPIMGPFSKLINIIGKSKTNDGIGYSQIKSAAGTYTIKNGVVQVLSLTAKSSSLELSASGSYNLDNDYVNMKFEINGFKKAIGILELIRPIVSNFPIIQGTLKYKAYGNIDKLKIIPDL